MESSKALNNPVLRWPALLRGAGVMLVFGVLAASAPARDLVDARAWVASARIDLHSTTPSADASDLEPLVKRLRNSRIIGLGDGSHGTREFYEIKHRLIEHLVASEGVRTIVFEGPGPEFDRLSAWVQTADGDPRFDLQSDWWFWNTGEMERLVFWARRWNREHPGRQVELRGVDMAIPASLIAGIDRDLLARRISSESLDCLREYWKYGALSEKEKAGCRAGLERLAARLGRDVNASPDLRRNVSMLLQAEELYRHGEGYDYARRDALMAENIIRLRDADPSTAPIVFWGHNGHVGSATIPFHDSQRAVGSYLAERYGDGYFSIGTIAAGGDFFVWDSSAEHPLRTRTYPATATTSYEQLLSAVESEAFILPLDSPEARAVMTPRQLSFGTGGVSVPQPVVSLPEMFDAIIFFRHTRPTRLLAQK